MDKCFNKLIIKRHDYSLLAFVTKFDIVSRFSLKRVIKSLSSPAQSRSINDKNDTNDNLNIEIFIGQKNKENNLQQ